MAPLVEVRELKKYYETSAGLLHAVDGVSFTIEGGQTLGVVGESGCGKSTLGRLILHLVENTSGSIHFDGCDITRVSRGRLSELRAQMQIIFQDPYSSLNPRMTVGETVGEPLLIMGQKPAEVRGRVTELLETVGLTGRSANLYPHELDGGRLQRVGIARALSLRPRFIVCDEPVSALDVSIQAQVINLMQDLQAEMGLTYLFISHDLSVVRHISDRIYVMYLGCAVEYCPAKELFRAPLHPYTRALLSAIPVPSLKVRNEPILLKGEISSPINLGPGCRFARRCVHATDICKAQEPQLREVKPGHLVACHLVEDNNGLAD